MRNLLRINLIVLTIILGVSGCRKDPPIPPDVVEPIDTIDTTEGKECPCCFDCEDFPTSPELGWFFTKSGTQYIAPQFNPNNENEFVYLRTGIEAFPELVKYNMLSESETVLCNSVQIITQPQWGKQGWILFTSYGNRIWRIYEDGTDLEQITEFNSMRPAFTTDANKFIVMGGPHPDILGEYRPIMNLEGTLVDSVPYKLGEIAIGYPYLSIDSSFYNSYQYYSDHALNKKGIGKLENGISLQKLNSINIAPSDITSNGEKIFYSTYWGKLYVLDLLTLQTKTFRSGCQTMYYNHIDISPSGDKLIVQKVISEVVSEEEILERNEIWLIDVNGCNDQKILGN